VLLRRPLLYMPSRPVLVAGNRPRRSVMLWRCGVDFCGTAATDSVVTRLSYALQSIVRELSLSRPSESLDVEVKTTTMGLINAVICTGPGRTDLQYRLHMRYEFILCGIEEVLPRLR